MADRLGKGKSLRRPTPGTGRRDAAMSRWLTAGSFLAAPFRLHHYRDVHTRMLRDSLCELDCGD